MLAGRPSGTRAAELIFTTLQQLVALVSCGWSFEFSAFDGHSHRSVMYGERAENLRLQQVMSQMGTAFAPSPQELARDAGRMRQVVLDAAIKESSKKQAHQLAEDDAVCPAGTSSEGIWRIPALAGSPAALGDSLQRMNAVGLGFGDLLERKRAELRARYDNLRVPSLDQLEGGGTPKPFTRDDLSFFTKDFPVGSPGAALHNGNAIFQFVGFDDSAATVLVPLVLDNHDILSGTSAYHHHRFQELEFRALKHKLDSGGFGNGPTNLFAKVPVDVRSELSQLIAGSPKLSQFWQKVKARSTQVGERFSAETARFWEGFISVIPRPEEQAPQLTLLKSSLNEAFDFSRISQPSDLGSNLLKLMDLPTAASNPEETSLLTYFRTVGQTDFENDYRFVQQQLHTHLFGQVLAALQSKVQSPGLGDAVVEKSRFLLGHFHSASWPRGAPPKFLPYRQMDAHQLDELLRRARGAGLRKSAAPSASRPSGSTPAPARPSMPLSPSVADFVFDGVDPVLFKHLSPATFARLYISKLWREDWEADPQAIEKVVTRILEEAVAKFGVNVQADPTTPSWDDIAALLDRMASDGLDVPVVMQDTQEFLVEDYKVLCGCRRRRRFHTKKQTYQKQRRWLIRWSTGLELATGYEDIAGGTRTSGGCPSHHPELREEFVNEVNHKLGINIADRSASQMQAEDLAALVSNISELRELPTATRETRSVLVEDFRVLCGCRRRRRFRTSKRIYQRQQKTVFRWTNGHELVTEYVDLPGDVHSEGGCPSHHPEIRGG